MKIIRFPNRESSRSGLRLNRLQLAALMLILNGLLMLGAVGESSAQIPRLCSYQGILDDGVSIANGSYSFAINYYDTSGRSVYSETYNNVAVRNGIFSLMLGSANGGFPGSMTFNQPYQIGISVNGGPELAPRSPLVASPYAVNASTVNGITASSSPVPGALYPLNASGKIDPIVLPATLGNVETINGVSPDAGGNLLLLPGTHVQIINNAPAHALTVGSIGIQTVTAGQGLVGGGSSDTVSVAVGVGGIIGTDIAPGAITGSKIAGGVAGKGLYQDGFGNLNVAADNLTLEVNNNVVRIKDGGVGTQELASGSVTSSKLAVGAVGLQQIDPTQIQRRVVGTPISGYFVQSINQDGSINGATVWTDATMTRTVVGNDLSLGLALYNPNNWTGLQNFFGGASASALNVAGSTTLNGLSNGGLLTNNGNVQINGALGVTGASTLSSVIANGNVTTNGNLVVTGSSDLRGQIKNTIGPITLQGNATLSGTLTSPSGGHALGTAGVDGNVLTLNGAIGGNGTELNVFGDGNMSGNLTIGGITNLRTTNLTTLNAGAIYTTILGGAGDSSAINLATGINAGLAGVAKTITGGVFSSYTLMNGTLSAGSTLTNLGTINSGKITNATILGSTLDNTPIGSGAPSTGAFTTLTSSGNTNLATGISTLNTFGGGSRSTNSIGGGTQSVTTIGGGDTTVNNFGTGAAAMNFFGNSLGTNAFSGLTNVGSLNSNGPKLVINGAVTTGFPGNADYELMVNGDALVTGTFTSPTAGFDLVTTQTQALSDITFNRGIILDGVAGQNNLAVGGTSSFTGSIATLGGIVDNGALTQSGVANFSNTSNFSGPVFNSGALDQTGAANFGGTVTILSSGLLHVNGTATFTGPVIDSGLFTANGGIEDNGLLTQNGVSNFENIANFLDTARFNGPIINAGSLIQNGAANFGGLLTVGSAGLLRVNGSATFNGPVIDSGSLTTVGSVINNGSFTMNGPATFTKPATFNGIANTGTQLQQDSATFNGAVVSNFSLRQSGPTTFTGPVVDSNTLVLADRTTFYAPVTNNSTLHEVGGSFFDTSASLNGILNHGRFEQQDASTFLGSVLNQATLQQNGLSWFTSLARFNSITDTGWFYQAGNSYLNGATTITSDNTATPTLSVIGTANSNSTYTETIYTAGKTGLSIQCNAEAGKDLSSATHFLDFIDGNGKVRGAVKGQTQAEFELSPTTLVDDATKAWDVIQQVRAIIKMAATIEAIAAVGAAAADFLEAPVCVALEGYFATVLPNRIAAVAGVAVKIGADVAYQLFKLQTIGVIYTSAGADYAEYLKRANPEERLSTGDIVGVKNGLISKNLDNAQNVFAISNAPIVLGNAPEKGEEHLFNKVGFLGQVPVKVLGVVHAGDFIIPSGNNDGFGIAIAADKITPNQFPMVVGRAWTGSDTSIFSFINVAVGLDAKAISEIASHEQDEIDSIKLGQQHQIDSLKEQVLGLQKENDKVNLIQAKLDRLEQLIAEPKNLTKDILLQTKSN